MVNELPHEVRRAGLTLGVPHDQETPAAGDCIRGDAIGLDKDDFYEVTGRIWLHALLVACHLRPVGDAPQEGGESSEGEPA